MGCLSPLATQRLLIRVLPAMLLLALLVLAFHHGRPGLGATFSFERPHDNGNDIGNGSGNGNSSNNDNDNSAWTRSPKPTELGELISGIFKPVKLPVTVESIVDMQGNRLDNGGRNSWNAPMGKDILIVDIETGIPPDKNGLFNIKSLDWDAVEGSGMLTVPHFNHYVYSQVHGYAYAFFYGRKGKDRYNTWTKPRVLQEMLRNHKFVVFVGTDATIGRPEVPMEFWLNRWNVTPSTPILMPADRQQAFDDLANGGRPSIKGKVELHTGVMIFQNIPATHEMMDAWRECTAGIRGGQWKERWTREQRAFAEYLRSVFNPQRENILLPCTDVNGFPDLSNKRFNRKDPCRGEFIRHYSRDTKRIAETSTDEELE